MKNALRAGWTQIGDYGFPICETGKHSQESLGRFFVFKGREAKMYFFRPFFKIFWLSPRPRLIISSIFLIPE